MMVDSIYNYPIISDDIPCDLLIFADMFDRSLWTLDRIEVVTSTSHLAQRARQRAEIAPIRKKTERFSARFVSWVAQLKIKSWITLDHYRSICFLGHVLSPVITRDIVEKLGMCFGLVILWLQRLKTVMILSRIGTERCSSSLLKAMMLAHSLGFCVHIGFCDICMVICDFMRHTKKMHQRYCLEGSCCYHQLWHMWSYDSFELIWTDMNKYMPYDLIGWCWYLSLVDFSHDGEVFLSYYFISRPFKTRPLKVGRPRSSTMDSRLAKNLAKLDKVGRRTTVPRLDDTMRQLKSTLAIFEK